MYNKSLICLIIIMTASIINCWGPFPNCGKANPQNLEDCDKYSLKSELGCCYASLYKEDNTTVSSTECILVGGRAQGWFNNRTELVSLSNLDFPQSVANRTEEAAAKYMAEIKAAYSGSPLAKVECVDNHVFTLKLTVFLILAVLMIIL